MANLKHQVKVELCKLMANLQVIDYHCVFDEILNADDPSGKNGKH